jgi:hypothetical protein
MTEFVWVITRETYDDDDGINYETDRIAATLEAAVALIKREYGTLFNYRWAETLQPNPGKEEYELDPIYEAVNGAWYPCREPYTITRMAIQEGT